MLQRFGNGVEGQPFPELQMNDRALFGRGQVIRREPDGAISAGCDPRSDGCTGET